MTCGFAALCLLVCLTASLGLVEPHDPQKRLLLTGTENLQQQYHSLQLEIQEMKTKYRQQDSTVTQMEATIRDLNNKVQVQENKTQSQENKIQVQESTIQGLRNIIQSLGNKSKVQESTIVGLENTIHSQESTIQGLGHTIHSQGTTIQNQESTFHQFSDQMSKIAQESGSVYIRWGKKTCSSNATLVYSGYTAGSYHTDVGSSSSSVCLPRDPIWSSQEPPMILNG